MIERKFVSDKIKEFQISNFISKQLVGAGYSGAQLKRTPLGDKVEISAAKPGLVVGRKGGNIRDITEALKNNFKLENPQVEIVEIKEPMLNAKVVGERIALGLERHGLQRFKRIGHNVMEQAIKSGALGIEVSMSGKIPSAKARTWTFYQGYMKKSGSVSQFEVDNAEARAELKSGTVGIKVKIMGPGIKLPDDIRLIGEEESDVQKRIEAAKASRVMAGGIEEVEEISKDTVEDPIEEDSEESATKTASESETKNPAGSDKKSRPKKERARK